MLLDLFFLLFFRDAEGRLVEVVVEQEVLQQAQEISIAEYGVELQELVAEVAIEILEESRNLTGGDYEVISVGAEPGVDPSQLGHSSAVMILTGSVEAVELAASILISSADPAIGLEFTTFNSDTASADVIDRD